jgi:hypothetical protein
MKKLLFLSLLLVVSACATWKQSKKHASVSELSTTNSEMGKLKSTHLFGAAVTEKFEDAEIKIHIVRYDTSQPVDPATGKPPVMEEESQTIGKHIHKTTKTEQESHSDQKDFQRQTDENQTDLNIDEKTVTETDVAGGRNFIWVWILLVVIAGAGFLLWMVSTGKNSRVFSKIFRG